MIKFFRKIRQQLLSENKFSRYLIYAIGEIILVMIGILLALQVNNWSENRKGLERQKKLYANLKIDFQNRLNELDGFYNAKNTAVENITRLSVIISKHESGFEESEVTELLGSLLNNFIFNEAFELLEGIFNTGQINDIRNEKLKRKLIEWPQLVEEMLEEQRIFESDNRNKYGPLLDKYISKRKLYEKLNFRKYTLPKGTPVSLKEDYKGLLSDPLLENYLAQKELLLRISIVDNKNLIESAKEIIALIDEQSE